MCLIFEPRSKQTLKHFQSLLNGNIIQSRFRKKVGESSLKLIRELFRNNLPRFSTIFRSRVADVFIRYSFRDGSYPSNDLWKFIENPKYWFYLKKFHHEIYSRKTMFNEMIEYLELTISSET